MSTIIGDVLVMSAFMAYAGLWGVVVVMGGFNGDDLMIREVSKMRYSRLEVSCL